MTKKYYYIYKTTNIITKRYYYGMHSTNDLNDGYMGSGKRLRYSINKYGEVNHKKEIIEFLPDRISLIEREKEIANLNEVAKEDCMNLMVGGKGGFISKEQQRHRSVCGGKALANRLKTDEEFRKRHSEISSKNMKKLNDEGKINHNTFFGKKHSKKTRKIMSEKRIGKYTGKENSQYNTCWITKDGVNKKIKKEDLEFFLKDGWEKGRK